MSEVKRLSTPLGDKDVKLLKAGDEVLITGAVYTARDMAHKRLCELIDAAKKLPFDLNGQVLYFVGPTPPSQGRVIGAAGPTTSSRMDAFSPKLIAAGLKGMIGKGYRSEVVRAALVKYGALHFSTIGGAGALLSRHITSAGMVAYEELGTEAIQKLEVVDFPCVVAYDAQGNSVYEQGTK
ncbi:MAG: Fe-S-containing hydro-lyase [Planctomycetota bacterium]|nr:MAG: Fe-S-containing hydro-lyase [Planctomycetota bacterium]